MDSSDVQQHVQQVVTQIVTLTQPVRIILFGSAVSGALGPDSDLDFLVVVPEGGRLDRVVDLLNTRVRPRTVPCDFVVVTPSLLKRCGETPGLVYREILASGREVYAL